MLVAIAVLIVGSGCDLSVEDDGDDEAVDTEDTRHDNGDDGLEDEVGLEDAHAADADAGLGGAVGSTEVAEHEGSSDAHVAEEGGASFVN